MLRDRDMGGYYVYLGEQVSFFWERKGDEFGGGLGIVFSLGRVEEVVFYVLKFLFWRGVQELQGDLVKGLKE